jgi:hypothetical protein
MSANHANKLRKEGITIIVEYGFIYNNNKNNKHETFVYLLELEKSIPYFFIYLLELEKSIPYFFVYLLELEKSIPYFFDKIQIRQICLYNQKDFFHRFTKQQKKEILDLHSRSIIMVE